MSSVPSASNVVSPSTINSEIRIRPVAGRDLPALAGLYNRVFSAADPMYSHPIDADRIVDRIVRHPDYDPDGVLAAVAAAEAPAAPRPADQQILGAVITGIRTHRLAADDPLEGASIAAVFVAPEARRRGIGRALVDRAIEFGRGRGRRRITAHPNPAAPFALFPGVREEWTEARALFEGAGFTAAGVGCTCRIDLAQWTPAENTVDSKQLDALGCRLEPCSVATAPALLDAAGSHYFYWRRDCLSKVDENAYPFLETSFLSVPGDRIYGPADVTILRRGDRVISFVVAGRDLDHSIACLGPVWTDPEFQRRGFGTTILQEAIRRERDIHGIRIADLWCGERMAGTFYAHNRFEVAARWTRYERAVAASVDD